MASDGNQQMQRLAVSQCTEWVQSIAVKQTVEKELNFCLFLWSSNANMLHVFNWSKPDAAVAISGPIGTQIFNYNASLGHQAVHLIRHQS